MILVRHAAALDPTARVVVTRLALPSPGKRGRGQRIFATDLAFPKGIKHALDPAIGALGRDLQAESEVGKVCAEAPRSLRPIPPDMCRYGRDDLGLSERLRGGWRQLSVRRRPRRTRLRGT